MSTRLVVPPHLDDVARMLADTSRLRMLWALGDGRAYTATELAQVSDLSASAASNHLARLVVAGFVETRAQGRHRYFTVTREDVGRAVEAMAAVSMAGVVVAPPLRPRATPALCHARRCYGHLAGACGVALWDTLVDAGLISGDGTAHHLTSQGQRVLASWGVSDVEAGPVKACLDWTERRWHLGGLLGRRWLSALQLAGVLGPSPSGDRVLLVDPHRWRTLLSQLAAQAVSPTDRES